MSIITGSNLSTDELQEKIYNTLDDKSNYIDITQSYINKKDFTNPFKRFFVDEYNKKKETTFNFNKLINNIKTLKYKLSGDYLLIISEPIHELNNVLNKIVNKIKDEEIFFKDSDSLVEEDFRNWGFIQYLMKRFWI